MEAHRRETGLSLPKEIVDLGLAIDAAIAHQNVDELERLDGVCQRNLTISEQYSAIIRYYRSNVHGGSQDAAGSQLWDWRQTHREKQLLYLRKAWTDADLRKIDRIRAAQIGTNLGSQLSNFGRTIEAIRLFDDVLTIVPNFAMALCNRALARMTLARLVHDEGHRDVIAAFAWTDYQTALGPNAKWEADYPEVIDAARRQAMEIERAVDVKAVLEDLELDDWSLGSTRAEIDYRRRILDLGLFLNPLNVLGSHAIAAADPLNLPSHTVKAGDPPEFIAWFNLLKQEFASARLLFHESHDGRRHFADNELTLVNTLDFPAFGIATERLRLAFRSAYGLLDKVAGFLNAYFGLDHKPNRVDLRGVWFVDPRKRNAIHPELEDRPNLPLRGLYWLSFDILGDHDGSEDTIAPDASQLNALRNSLEHRCLVLRDPPSEEPMGIVQTQSLANFRADTLRMLELAHAALLYLSFAMHIEERARRSDRDGLAVDMPLPTYERW